MPDPIPADRLYHPAHDWARIEGDTATFGVTWYAQDLLGEIVFWDGPEVGTTITLGEPYAELESVKAVSDVIAPLSGEVLELNPVLADDPGRINESPYEDGWLAKVKIADPAELEQLLDAGAYRELLG